jgi:hypothetical protein
MVQVRMNVNTVISEWGTAGMETGILISVQLVVAVESGRGFI